MGCIVWGYPQYFKSLTVYRSNTLATPRSTRSVASHHSGVYLAVAGVALTCRVYHTMTWRPIALSLNDNSLANPTFGCTVEWNPNGNELLNDGQLYALQENTMATSNANNISGTDSSTATTMAFLQHSTTLLPSWCGCGVNCIGPKWSPNGRFIATGHDSQAHILNGDGTASNISNGTTSIGELVANHPTERYP
jgi:hypothetical protein